MSNVNESFIHNSSMTHSNKGSLPFDLHELCCGRCIGYVAAYLSSHTWMSHSLMTHPWLTQTRALRPLTHMSFVVVAVQGAENSKDASSCLSFFAKEPLIIRLFCGKWPMKIRHPMTPRHSVSDMMLHICHVTWMSQCHITHEWVMSHMNKSFRSWMSHVTFACVVLQDLSLGGGQDESRHIWVSEVTYEGVASHMRESCHIFVCHESRPVAWHRPRRVESRHIWVSQATYQGVVSHVRESCHIFVCHESRSVAQQKPKRVTSHMSEWGQTWVSHVTYEGVMSHMRVPWVKICCSAQAKTSHVTYEWVRSQMRESCHICVCHESRPVAQQRPRRVTSHMSEWGQIWVSHVT